MDSGLESLRFVNRYCSFSGNIWYLPNFHELAGVDHNSECAIADIDLTVHCV